MNPDESGRIQITIKWEKTATVQTIAHPNPQIPKSMLLILLEYYQLLNELVQ